VTLSDSLQHRCDHAIHFHRRHHALARLQSHGRNMHSASRLLTLLVLTVAATTMYEHGAPCLRFRNRTVVMEWRNNRYRVRKKEKHKPSNNKHGGIGMKGRGRKKNETNEMTSFHFFANSSESTWISILLPFKLTEAL